MKLSLPKFRIGACRTLGFGEVEEELRDLALEVEVLELHQFTLE